MEPRYSRIIPRILQDSRHLTRMMDVFDKQYRIFRIVLKIVGLWPYDNSFYVWIQRLWLINLLSSKYNISGNENHHFFLFI